jgi:release factor glutamine methyltransferase
MRIEQWLCNAKPLLAAAFADSPIIYGENQQNTQQLVQLEAELLLSEALQKSRGYLRSHGEKPLDSLTLATATRLLQQRANGHPIAYITGVREFFGRDFLCTADTLIPRPDTETLIEHCLSLPLTANNSTVLDLGTGTGAIGITLQLEKTQWRVHCLDISKSALAVANQNARHLNAQVEMMFSDWFSAVQDKEKYALIVSNPPYVEDAHELLAQGDVKFEPLSALISGSDGLEDIRKLIQQAPTFLETAGWLVLEHGHTQHQQIQQLLINRGFERVQTVNDLTGTPRITSGQWAAGI